MKITKIIDAFGYVIYATLALLAVWGVYNAILLYRGLGKKSIGDAKPLLDRVGELIQGGKIEAAVAACQDPPYWHSALAQLMSVALKNRDKGLAKVKQIIVMEFHTEVIAGMENRLASLSTIVRMGPLLGLLGTVASMIGAFGRIGGSEKVNPNALAVRHQPRPLGDRLGPADRHPDDDSGQRHPRQAPPPPRPDRTAAPGVPRHPRAGRAGRPAQGERLALGAGPGGPAGEVK